MLHNKKTFLLLLAIPMYLATKYFLLLTFDISISVPLLTSFCMFILSAVCLLYSRERLISVQISIIVHLAVVIPVLLNVSTIQYSKQDLLLYSLFFLPALFYFALFCEGDSVSDEGESKNNNIVLNVSFYCVLFVLAGILFWLVTHKKISLSPNFDINSSLFVLLCLLPAVLIIKKKNRSNPLAAFLKPLLVLSLFETAVYIIWANKFFTVEFEPLFALVLINILIMDIALKEHENLKIKEMSVEE